MYRQHLKNPHAEKALLQRRLWVLGCGIALATMGLIARLLFLQVDQYDNYSKKADSNQYKLEPIPPKRGIIYDRNHQILAENIPAHRLEIIPSKSPDIDATLTKLRHRLHLDKATIEQFKDTLKNAPKNKPIPLKMQLTETDIARFYVDRYQYPEASIQSYLIRHYPEKEVAASILGYVAHINTLPQDNDERFLYQVNPFRGVIGIEQSYETTLRGYPGYRKLAVNASGKVIDEIEVHPPTPGADLVLTIDAELQAIAQQALGKELGAAVVINPQNGEVLALATNPSYDPNVFVTGIRKATLRALSDAETKPMFNRALRGQFPLASTIKPFLGLGALEKGIITPSDSIEDKGHYIYPHTTHVYRDWLLEGHGRVNLRRAIVLSCDTYFYELAVKMGIENIVDVLDSFGFGHKTHIDVHDEAGGLIATPIWKKTHKGLGWYAGDTILSGIGQGFLLTTPIQLAQATATLANHGNGYVPYVVKRIEPVNQPAIKHTVEALAPVLLHEENWRVITRAMEAVVKPGGTGGRFGFDHPYRIAAKTGTAQIRRNEKKVANDLLPKRQRDHSLFIGFSPVDKAEIAVAVITENSAIAPAVARVIFDHYHHVSTRALHVQASE